MGFVPAMRKLGFLFFLGDLVNVDLEIAWLWFSLSRTGGDKDGRYHCLMTKEKAKSLGTKLDLAKMSSRSIDLQARIFGQAVEST